MTRELSSLLAQFAIEQAPKQAFNHLNLDSRAIQTGDIFVAINGHQVDGRKYIASAINQGAVAIIEEAESEQAHGQVRWIDAVPVIAFWRLPSRLSQLAQCCYFPDGNPLTVIGVTGTNGKSTITHLIAALAAQLGVPAAVMGTLGNGKPGSLVESANTTGDAISVQRQLAEFAEQGIEWVAMEVSSHGLVQGRVASVPFKLALFSNLSQDHLDYHGDMAEYGKAKQMLFDWPSLEHRLINADDGFGKQLLQHYSTAKSLSLEDSSADFQLTELRFSASGAQGELLSPYNLQRALDWQSPLLGRFNAENMLAAIAACACLGLPLEALLQASVNAPAVPGRMEMFQADISVVVDYSHTPDALDKALQALRLHCDGQLWCVFGCGGDRDAGKRPLMAQAAERGADKVIITDDNPRFEDPEAIVRDTLAGLSQPELAQVEHNREKAIALAITQAQAGDMILVAGKGHEDYQIYASEKIHLDDREVVKSLLEAHR